MILQIKQVDGESTVTSANNMALVLQWCQSVLVRLSVSFNIWFVTQNIVGPSTIVVRRTTSNPYYSRNTRSHKPGRWELTHEESQAPHVQSFPSSKHRLNILFVMFIKTSTTIKSVYLFLDSISPRPSNKVSLLLNFYTRWLIGFQVVRPCFAQKSDNFLKCMSLRPLVTSISPLTSSMLSNFTLKYACISIFSELKARSHINQPDYSRFSKHLTDSHR